MVRVISVHHFSSQHIHVCDDPVAVTSASPERLLVALANHVVQVRDLSNGGEVAFTFPTVDQVQQIVYCASGNYVATLETKLGRQGKTSVYSRIYVNWDVPSSNRENAVVRARVAGRVTPSAQQCSQDVVEMIELPLKRTPTTIACCQHNGSVLLSSNKLLTLYHYRVRTHDISRHKFVDFEESGLSLELSFAPTHIEICEDVIACMSSMHAHLFRIGWENMLTRGASIYTPTKPVEAKRTEVPRSVSKDYIDWNAVLRSAEPPPEFWNQLDPDFYPVIVDLPSIASEQLSEATSHLHQSPFLSAAPEMTVNVKCRSPTTLWTEGVRICNLLQLKMNPMLEPGSSSKQVLDEFRCLVLKPFYIKQSVAQQNNAVDAIVMNPLQSSQYSSLASIICVVATQQEGYFYHFPMTACNKGALSYKHYDLKQQQNACVTVYPFTAPVSTLVLEYSLLHALTETGLETYTTRSGHHLVQRLDEIDNNLYVCPMASDPVCLVGLRPFLGVEHLVLSDSHLVLLASSEGSSISSQDSQAGCTSWTLYSLCLPTVSVLYSDILSVAATHRWSSPSTYYHLLAEAHVIVRTHRCLVSDDADQLKVNQLYCESCALLGDFYLSGDCEESWLMAAPYYKMSGLTPFNVIDRLSEMQEQLIDLGEGQNVTYTPGLMHYLKTCLLQMSKASDELLFTPAVPTFINLLLDLFEVNAPKQLAALVLNSKVLREYATDRVLTVMKSQLHAGPSPEPSDALALALLCIQKSFPSQAVAVLNTLPSDTLTCVLTAHHHLVVEPTDDKRRDQQCLALTELATILLESKPTVLARVLYNLVVETTDVYTLQNILQVFVELLPRLGQGGSAASPVLQCFLEQYFAWFYKTYDTTAAYDSTTVEALKILVRSYLSDLQRPHYPTTASSPLSLQAGILALKKEHLTDAMTKVLFYHSRPDFLTKMDPTAVYVAPDQSHNATSLFKLQALLSSGKLPSECVSEAHQFVKSHSRTHGHLTLLVLCLPAKPAAGIILNFCPEAILPFCREKFQCDEEWHWIISKLQQKIKSMEEDNFRKDHCIQILTDVLTYLSQTLPLESLIPMLPSGEKCVQSYIRTCQEMSHASHISALLVATGHQLLNTLNL